MDSGKGLYGEHKGIDIAVHAHEVEGGKWLPRVVLFEPTIGTTRELDIKAQPTEGFPNEDEALAAGMRCAIEALGRLHAAAPSAS